MFGNQKDGFQIAGKFIFVTIVDTILEHNKENYILLMTLSIIESVNFLYQKYKRRQLHSEVSPWNRFFN